ncbi:MAG: hypothetical protein AAGA54_37195 [Myxococcota bacterium]
MLPTILAVCLASSPSVAPPDESSVAVPLQAGLFVPYGTQPGARVAVPVEFRARTFTRARRRRSVTRTGSLFAGPRLGAFVRPAQHWSLTAQGEFGYKLRGHRRGVYSAFGVGAGYLLEARIVRVRVDLGTADTDVTREFRHGLLPEASYTVGQDFENRWGWYLRPSVGAKILPSVGSSLFMAIEVGFRVRLMPRRAR